MQKQFCQEAGAPLSRWIFFPPFFSVLILILTAVLHRKEAAFDVPAIVWGLAIAAYVCLCGISAFYIMKRDARCDAGISLLAQGLLLSVVAVQAGIVVFTWIGLIIFMIGLFFIFLYTTRHDAGNDADVETEDSYQLLSKLNIPICYTDTTGFVEEVSAAFLEAVGNDAEKVVGEQIAEVIPVNSEEVSLPSGKWWLETITSGGRNYFYLRPTRDGKPPKEQPQLQKKKSASGSISLTDQETGLYTNEYRKLRGPEEVSRAQRYKRPLSGLLLELAFDASSSSALSEKQFEMLRNAFAVKVKSILRTTDCGFLTDDQKQIQLLLPETSQVGAKTLMNRLLLLPKDIFDEYIRLTVEPKVKAGMYFYNGASNLEYGVFSATLEQAFANAKEGTSGSSSTV
jgi:PAS domain-containing protein